MNQPIPARSHSLGRTSSPKKVICLKAGSQIPEYPGRNCVSRVEAEPCCGSQGPSPGDALVSCGVVWTGRTNNLARREGEHGRDKKLKDYRFEVIFRTDNYSEQRGLEQLAHESHGRPPLNRVNGINPYNPRRNHYPNAADDFLMRFGVG